jgi:hypothetical protein
MVTESATSVLFSIRIVPGAKTEQLTKNSIVALARTAAIFVFIVPPEE